MNTVHLRLPSQIYLRPESTCRLISAPISLRCNALIKNIVCGRRGRWEGRGRGRRRRRESWVPHLVGDEEDEEEDEVDCLEQAGVPRKGDQQKGPHHCQYPVGGQNLLEEHIQPTAEHLPISSAGRISCN